MNIMSQKIAITGGIGSGKTFICHLLTARGIKIYDCDKAAKRLMRENDDLKCKLTNLIGDDVYQNGMVVKSVLASFLLKSNENKQAVNNIIHQVALIGWKAQSSLRAVLIIVCISIILFAFQHPYKSGKNA